MDKFVEDLLYILGYLATIFCALIGVLTYAETNVLFYLATPFIAYYILKQKVDLK